MKTIIDQFTKTFLPISSLVPGAPPGGTGYFSGSDTMDTFKKNLLIQPADWHYRPKQVSYTVNSECYRALEWDAIDWANSVVIFGCSMTFGVGLAEDETIGYQLAQLLNRPVINLGVGGASTMFCHQNSVLLNKNFPTPWAVVQAWSGPDRISAFDNETTDDWGPSYFYGPWTIDMSVKRPESGRELYRAWSRISVNALMHSYFAITSSDALWKPKTRYCSASFWDPLDDNTIKLIFRDRARDMAHPGRQSAIIAATQIAEVLNAQ